MRKALVLVFSILAVLLLSSYTFTHTGALSAAPAIEWDVTYGGTNDDCAYSMVQTSDGYVLSGYTESFGAGGQDFWMVKTDFDGAIEWNKTYGGSGNERARSIIMTKDGGYALVGRTNSFGAGEWDFWVIKTDSSGNHVWNKTCGGGNEDAGYAIIQTDDLGYAVVGHTHSYGDYAGRNIWLVKLDLNGYIEWNMTYGGSAVEMAYSLVQADDGGFAIVGYTHSFGAGSADIWLLKTNSNGILEWSKTFGGSGLEKAFHLIKTTDGGYAIAGETYSYGHGGDDFWLIKTDVAGSLEWNKTYGWVDHEREWQVTQTSDSGYALVGYTISAGVGLNDIWLVKTDSFGNKQWNNTYGGSSYDYGISVIQTTDQGYVVLGQTDSFGAGAVDFWLIRLGSELISATVDIDPDTLNLKSNGQWITAYITLPAGYQVEEIDIATMELKYNNWDLLADWGDIQDGVLMVKFDRIALRDHLGATDFFEAPRFCDISLTVSGKLLDGTSFEGSDTIAVLRK